jgi:hypothetical protein
MLRQGARTDLAARRVAPDSAVRALTEADTVAAIRTADDEQTRLRIFFEFVPRR